METIKCDLCQEMVDIKKCIKTKNSQNVRTVCCVNCRPEYQLDVDNLWNNPKIKLQNPPIKKI